MRCRRSSERLGGGRPSGPATADCGSVTAETAVALPALCLALSLVLAVVGQGLDHVRAADAARSAARALARGELEWSVVARAREEAPPEALVEVGTSAGLVQVTVSAPGRRLLGLRLPPVVERAAVAQEQPGLADAGRSS